MTSPDDLVDVSDVASGAPPPPPARARARAGRGLPGFAGVGRGMLGILRTRGGALARALLGLAVLAALIWLIRALWPDGASEISAMTDVSRETMQLAAAGGAGLGGGLMIAALRSGQTLHGNLHLAVLVGTVVVLSTPIPNGPAISVLLPGLVGYGAASFIVLLVAAVATPVRRR